jgi:hypothetical protein
VLSTHTQITFFPDHPLASIASARGSSNAPFSSQKEETFCCVTQSLKTTAAAGSSSAKQKQQRQRQQQRARALERGAAARCLRLILLATAALSFGGGELFSLSQWSSS